MTTERILEVCGLTAAQVRAANGRHVKAAKAEIALVVFDEAERWESRRQVASALWCPTRVMARAWAFGLYGETGPMEIGCLPA